MEQILKFLWSVDVAQNSRVHHRNLVNPARNSPHHRIQALIRSKSQNLLEQFCREKGGMSAVPVVIRKNDPSRTQPRRKQGNCLGIDQWLVYEKDSRA